MSHDKDEEHTICLTDKAEEKRMEEYFKKKPQENDNELVRRIAEQKYEYGSLPIFTLRSSLQD